MPMHNYPIEVSAETPDIKQIEFNQSKMFILFNDGHIAVYKYQYIGGILDGNNNEGKSEFKN